MIKYYKLFLLLFLAFYASESLFCQTVESNRCGAMQNLDRLVSRDASIPTKMNQIEEFTKIKRATSRNNNNLITIPVVFHVIYYEDAQNIPDKLVHSQLTVLNEDFRRKNLDASKTPWMFQGLAADTQIEFCLANVDPNGFVTSGITHTRTEVSLFSPNDEMKFKESGGRNAWPTNDYLNIWVCPLKDGLLGYAQFPEGGPKETDGVVIGVPYCGRPGTGDPLYRLGRTATHEVGHWLNLRHIWGDGACDEDDLVDDTPMASEPNTGKAIPCGYNTNNSCFEDNKDMPDMIQNYMDYTSDMCMNLFTKGQKDRMRELFVPGGFRESLLWSKGCSGDGIKPTCADNYQNGDEQKIDCGGSYCLKCPLEVCQSRGASSSYEWIDSVRFNVYTNYSGNNSGYGDFTDQTLKFNSGTTVYFDLFPGFLDEKYKEFWSVWVDYNQDKDFNDEGELVYSTHSGTSEAITSYFKIPEHVEGETKMRIVMKFVDEDSPDLPTTCSSFPYGETEDYTVSFSSKCKYPSFIRSTVLSDNTVRVTWEPNNALEYIVEFRSPEHTWRKLTTTNNSIFIHNLLKNTVYTYRIRTKCSDGSSSISPSKTFRLGGRYGSRINKQETIAISPNPTINKLTVSISEGHQISSYKVFNTIGEVCLENRLVAKELTNKEVIDVNLLGSGIYFLAVKNNQTTNIIKFIKL